MSNLTVTDGELRLNLLEIPCREKHAMIFDLWSKLPVGGHFVLINDHDPVPLYYQFAAQFAGAFEWVYLVAGPDEFHIRIERVAPSPSHPAVMPHVPAGMNCGAKRAGEFDLRGLAAPEPMIRILEEYERLAPGGEIRAVTERRPVFLFPELEARGARYMSEERGDGAWTTRVVRV